MAFIDLHEGVLAEFAARATPETSRVLGRWRQASARTEAKRERHARREEKRRLLRRVYDLRYLARWPERRRATAAQWRERHRQEIAAVMREWYSRHTAAKRADSLRRYYADHEANKRAQRWRATDRRRQAGLPPRSTMYLTVGRDRRTVVEWAAATGLSRAAIAARIAMGWPPSRVVGEPVGTVAERRAAAKVAKQRPSKRRLHLVVDGVRRTFAEWARRSGLSSAVIRHRIDAGWSPARAVSEPARRYVRTGDRSPVRAA